MNPLEHSEQHHRRQMDETLEAIEDKIVKLIEETNEAKDKAYLLILMKINDSIGKNNLLNNKMSIELREISKNMGEHEALINRSRGWRDILIWVLGIIQTLGVLIIVSLNNDLQTVQKELEVQKIEIRVLQALVNPILGK